jgi:hypothetical protein
MPPRLRILQIRESQPRATEAARQAFMTIRNARRFAFSILVAGSTYSQATMTFLWNDIIPPSETSFYQAQKGLFKPFDDLARSSCELVRRSLLEGTVISFDGSWSHRRRAKECVVVVVVVGTDKIIDYELIRRPKSGNPGNYDGSANGMECEALARIVQRLKSDARIVGYVHDNDSTAAKVITDAGWAIQEWLDPNHISKCYDRRWQKAPRSALNGLGVKLKKGFNFLIHGDFSDEQKVLFWENTLNHFRRDHTNCPEGHSDLRAYPQMNDPLAVSQLTDFIRKTASS